VTAAVDVAAGSRRLVGRPRDTTLDQQILRTVRELLAERGYQGLTVQEVTRRCGVHAATIARRWESKPALATAAILRDDQSVWADDRTPWVPTGQLRKDLRRMVANINHFLADSAVRAALPIAWSEVHNDPGVRDRLQRRREQWSMFVHEVLEAAVLSGDAPPRVLSRAELLTDVLAGTAFARQGLGQRVLDDSSVDALTDLVLNGLLADDGVPQ
jgi:AcrR family transcriptional regulator